MLSMYKSLLDKEYRLKEAHFFPDAFVYEDRTPAHHFTSVVCLCEELQLILLVNARDVFDERLCKSVIEHARSHKGSLSIEKPVMIIEGFRSDRYAFDSVLVLNWECHGMYEMLDQELNRRTLEVAPIYRCEFVGDETPREIDEIRHRGPCTIDWTREPAPIVYLRYKNRKTKSGANKKIYMTVSATLVQLEALPADGESYVQIENFRREVVKITRRPADYEIEPKAPTGKMSIKVSDLGKWLDSFLKLGLAHL